MPRIFLHLHYLPISTRGGLCPHFLLYGKPADWRRVHIYVWGAPLKCSPMEDPPHKRSEMSEPGWFAGIQWPMAIVLRKSDKKLISVSFKKIKVYESIYATKLDEPIVESMTMKNFEHQEVNDGLQAGASDDETAATPEHVQSITSVSAHTKRVPGITHSSNEKPARHRTCRMLA